MKAWIRRHYYAIRDISSGVSCVLACAVLISDSWFMPDHSLPVHMSLTGLMLFGIWLDWRSGMLSLPLKDMPLEVRRRGMMAFGWVRPLPLLGFLLTMLALRKVPLVL